MNEIRSFLERYKNYVAPPLSAARAVRAALQDILGISVGERAITVKNGRADISIDSLQKTEVLMHKETILAKVRTTVGDSVREIR